MQVALAISTGMPSVIDGHVPMQYPSCYYSVYRYYMNLNLTALLLGSKVKMKVALSRACCKMYVSLSLGRLRGVRPSFYSKQYLGSRHNIMDYN